MSITETAGRALRTKRAARFLLRLVAFAFAVALLAPLAPRNGEVQAQAHSDRGGAANEQALVLHAAGRYAEALAAATRGLEARVAEFGADHELVAQAHNTVGVVLFALSRYPEAEHHYQRCLTILERKLPPGDALTGWPIHGLGTLYVATGRHQEAESFLKRALLLWADQTDPIVVQTLGNLGTLLMVQQRFGEAQVVLRRALSIAKASFGDTSAEILQPLHNLASLYDLMGREQEAVALFEEAIPRVEQRLGATHPALAMVLNGLAEIRRQQGRLDEAEQLATRVRDIRRTAFAPNHPMLAASLVNMAAIQRERGNVAGAEASLRAALAIVERPDVGDRTILVPALNNLAELLRDQERQAEAMQLYVRGLQLIETHGDADGSRALLLNNIGVLAAQQGRTAMAISSFESALAIREKLLEADHPIVTETVRNLLAVFEKEALEASAAPLRRRLAAAPGAGTRNMRLLFATNRVPEGEGFGNRPDAALRYGQVTMRVPQTAVADRAKRIAGSLGQLELAREGDLAEASGLLIVERRMLDDRAFAATAEAAISRSATFARHVLVFVHGYNTSFDAAVQRAAQLGFDLDFDGLIVAFAWPSQGVLTGYATDSTNARASVDALGEVITRLRRELPDAVVHVVAHSLGNEIATQGLCRLATSAGSERMLGEYVAAHPDVDPIDFERATNCLRPLVRGATVYINANDAALRTRCAVGLSIDLTCRAGNAVRGYDSIDAIDTSELKAGWYRWLKGFDHDVFVRNPIVFSEVARLILTGQRPVHQRSPEFVKKTDGSNRTLWSYDRNLDVAFGG